MNLRVDSLDRLQISEVALERGRRHLAASSLCQDSRNIYTIKANVHVHKLARDGSHKRLNFYGYRMYTFFISVLCFCV
jgi:hypothetical protein